MSTRRGIPKNQVRSRNVIEQAEHEDIADARRVLLVDKAGNTIGDSSGNPVFIEGNISVTEGGASQPNVVNIELPAMDTEYDFTIPQGARRYSFRARGNAKLTFNYVAASSEFMTLYPGKIYEVNNLNLTNFLTIFVKSNKNNEIIELEYWT